MVIEHASADYCGCCEGLEKLTPAAVDNRPGLSALAYRVGTHGRFKQSMLAALGREAALSELTTRESDDPTIGLIDAWATVLDVLAFYQERVANEGYLRTATERRSVLELARRIGYELRPGVAAGTYLAFELETAPGAPLEAVIPEGTRAQSLPGQDEQPQTFETVEEIEAHAAWNGIGARLSESYVPGFGARHLYLAGTSTNLAPGDALLILGDERRREPGDERWDFRLVKTVTKDVEAGRTTVELDRALGSAKPFTSPAADPEVYALRRRAALFGHNAPDWTAMPKSIKDAYDPPRNNDPRATEWPDFSLRGIAQGDPEDASPPLYLDSVYAKVVPGSWVVVATPDWVEAYEVETVQEDSRTDFTLTAKTTRLELSGENLEKRFDGRIRDAVVYVESELLARAERPLTGPVSGNTILLAAKVEGLAEEQKVIVAGLAVDGGRVAEVATIEGVEVVDGTTRLTLDASLAYSYQRASVKVHANVARATHGETTSGEVLGSGDGSKTFQGFQLKKKPLTHVSAATTTGTESTLELRVDDVLWDEAATLYDQDAGRRVYVTRRADDGTVRVLFGDGRSGARLPTGSENVKAAYRHGIGLDGMVAAGQISLLATRPLGVKGVSNPLAPTGAADPEVLADARSNAPLTVLTLDRIVSLADYEDFTRAFAGIAKAQAALLWDGERRLVHLTVAGAEGSPVTEGSDLKANLLAAIDAARHAEEKVTVQTYEPLAFGLAAGLLIDADRVAGDVLTAAKEALVAEFSFAKRGFGQGVTAGEVLALLQRVPGVIAVDLDALDGQDPFDHPRVSARTADWDGGVLRAAELLLVDADDIVLTEKTS